MIDYLDEQYHAQRPKKLGLCLPIRSLARSSPQIFIYDKITAGMQTLTGIQIKETRIRLTGLTKNLMIHPLSQKFHSRIISATIEIAVKVSRYVDSVVEK